jgi:hypothetical protein
MGLSSNDSALADQVFSTTTDAPTDDTTAAPASDTALADQVFAGPGGTPTKSDIYPKRTPRESPYDPNRYTIGQEIPEALESLYHRAVAGWKGLYVGGHLPGLSLLGASTESDPDAAAKAVRDELAKQSKYPARPADFGFDPFNYRKTHEANLAAQQRAKQQYYAAHPDIAARDAKIDAMFQDPGRAAGDLATSLGATPGQAAVASAVPAAVAAGVGTSPGFTLGGGAGVFERPPPRTAGLPVPPPMRAPVDFPSRSMGAAEALPDLSGTSPEFQAAHTEAQARGPINPEVRARHIRAENLPVPAGTPRLQLDEGQATHDPAFITAISDLKSDPAVQGLLTARRADQENALVGSMGEIRRLATPGIVHNTNVEHGQNAIDAMKEVDNARLDDISSKYQAMRDANNGEFPLDTPKLLANVNSELHRQMEFDDAPASVLKKLKEVSDRGNMTFEEFEQMRSKLARLQRTGPTEGRYAAGIIRDQLEEVPLTGDAAGLRDLADVARKANKARESDLRQIPAYRAAIKDGNPLDDDGRHVIGEPSLQAPAYMDKYFTGTGTAATSSPAAIMRAKNLMQGHPAFHDAVEAATLNDLSDAAGVNTATGETRKFKSATYGDYRQALDDKINLLVKPETAQRTQDLAGAAADVHHTGTADINTSGSINALKRYLEGDVPSTPASETAEDLGATAAHAAASFALGDVTGAALSRVGARILKGKSVAKARAEAAQRKLDFARRVTKPGAGLNYPTK